jgi:uncharacterized protein with PhoU and TrkA domain
MIETGMPVILTDAKGLEDYNLFSGQEGIANSVINIEGSDYVYFMPSSQMKMYAMKAVRLVVDEEKLNAIVRLVVDEEKLNAIRESDDGVS